MKLFSGTLGLLFLLVAAIGCGGGGSSTPTTTVTGGSCPDGAEVCLQSCNLGCSTAGCAISDIAVNQPLIFQFNTALDPTSVNQDSFSIKTATGSTPAGELRAIGSVVYFMPEIKEVGSQTFYGFQKGESYTIHMAAGDNAADVIKSVSGAPVQTSLTCSIVVTKDVIDLDGKDPSVSLVVPTSNYEVPTDSTIVLRFSEFVLPSTVMAPSSVEVKVAQVDPTTGMAVPCDKFVKSDQLQNMTELTLIPKNDLPGSIKVMVSVKSGIQDLSGNTLKRTDFFFSTSSVVSKTKRIEETFNDTAQKVIDKTGALWGNGKLSCGPLGGSGILGEFNHQVGSILTFNKYVFNGDNATFPASVTLDGKPHSVTDCVFEFANFVVPKGVTVRFEGSKPIRIKVRGSAIIEGRLEVDGLQPADAGNYNSIGSQRGAFGAMGGPGASAGGKGGGEPGSLESPNGQNGVDLIIPAGHPRASQAVGTGGIGSPCFPRDAKGQPDNTKVKLDYFGYYSIQFAGVGGPGSFVSAGKGGGYSASQSQYKTTHGLFPGLAKTFAPLPLATTTSTIDQLLIGGAGGGGGGVCPYGTMMTTVDWQRGNGGGGGGGAMAIQCGGNLQLASSGIISARGGAGGGGMGTLTPGGPGSGGSLLVQVGNMVSSSGIFDLRGGPANNLKDFFQVVDVTTAEGGKGFLRVEAPTAPSHTSIGSILPSGSSDNTGKLTDEGPVSGAASQWYSPQLLFPKYHYYEIDATIGTQKVLFTDNPNASNPCVLGVTPIAIFFKGAQVDAQQVIIPTTISRWVPLIGDMLDSNKNGGVPVPPQRFRWTVILDKSLASGQNIVIDKISVVVSD